MKKTSSKVIQYAAARAAGLKSIAPALDLGNQMTVSAFDTAIADAHDKLSAYHWQLH